MLGTFDICISIHTLVVKDYSVEDFLCFYARVRYIIDSNGIIFDAFNILCLFCLLFFVIRRTLIFGPLFNRLYSYLIGVMYLAVVIFYGMIVIHFLYSSSFIH